MKELIFAYGTLKEDALRKKILGRDAGTSPDALHGYRKTSVKLGRKKITYPAIEKSDDRSVEGVVFEVDQSELGALDKYEGRSYLRRKVVLGSGKVAWVYVKAGRLRRILH